MYAEGNHPVPRTALALAFTHGPLKDYLEGALKRSTTMAAALGERPILGVGESGWHGDRCACASAGMRRSGGLIVPVC